MRTTALVLAAGLALGTAFAGAAAATDIAVSEHPALPHIRQAADFTLRSSTGEAVSLSGLGRKIRLVSFIYTSCNAACPLLAERMARLQEAVAAAGRAADLELVSITVDPARDDAREMTAFGQRFGADPASWRFLTDRHERIRSVLVAYDEWTSDLANGILDHPARVHLIDRNGTVREIYSLSFFDERQALVDVLALAAEPAS